MNEKIMRPLFLIRTSWCLVSGRVMTLLACYRKDKEAQVVLFDINRDKLLTDKHTMKDSDKEKWQ